jgi:hypothetical protein
MRIIGIAQIALLVCMGHTTAHGRETRPKLAVCLQLETPDPHLISTLAQGLATKIFAHVGIPLNWRACKPAGEASQTPIVIRLTSRTPEEFMPGVLGYATPYRRHIVIFFDRIERMPDAWSVLGHVMAHEITHIIQGVSRHSQTGLMKAHWSSHDILEMRHKPLPFTREDLDLLHAGLATRGKSEEAPTITP